MTDQLISFETAKLACKKGFREEQEFYIDSESRINHVHRGFMCPTQSLLQKWLREIHNFFICIKCDGKSKFDFHGYPLNEETWTGQRDKEYGFGPEIGAKPYRFNSYEEALEIGLQEALKLI
jgi:hypothetical protein